MQGNTIRNRPEERKADLARSTRDRIRGARAGKNGVCDELLTEVMKDNARQGSKISTASANENAHSDKKLAALSRSSTPENAEFGDSREQSSLSDSEVKVS